MTWSALETFVFSGYANGAAIAPSSYASPSTGQAWADVYGGRFAITGGQLVGTTDTVDGSQFKRDFLISGSASDALSQRIVTTVPVGYAGDFFNVMRYQRTGNVGNSYVAGINTGGGSTGLSVYLLQGSGNSATQIGAYQNYAFNAGHSYQLDTSVVGSNPTAIFVTVTDLTTSTVVLTATASDSTSNLQAAGGLGLDITNASGAAAAQSSSFSQINTYSYSASASTIVSLPQANIYFSPQGWDLSTSGHAIANASGNYLKASLTTSAAGALSLNLNLTNLISTDVQKPYLTWSIDGGAPQQLQLTTANTTGSLLQLSSNLTAGTHSLQIWVRGASPFANHWTTGATNTFVDITGFTLGGGGTGTFNSLTALPNLALFYGDSMTEGEGTDGFVTSGTSSSYAQYDDATHSYVPHLAAAFNCEYSSAAFGGQGWTGGAADGTTPGLSTSWNYLYSGKSRTFSAGLNYVFVNMGTNGNTIGSTGTVSTFLTNLRAALTAAGSTAKIVLFVPWSGAARSALITDFTTYQGSVTPNSLDQMTYYTGSNDAKAVLIDLGAPVGLPVPATTNSAGSLYSFDTTHLSTYGNQRIVGMAARAVQAAFTGASSGTGRSFSFS